MKRYEKEKANPNQFIRIDGNKKFLEVLAPTPDFNQVTVNFVDYQSKDQSGRNVEQSFYFTISEFLVLCKKIEQGIIQRTNEQLKTEAKEKNLTYARSVVCKYAGKANSDGKTGFARNFCFTPATQSKNADIILKIEYGLGTVTPEGLINIDYKQASRIPVSMSYDKLLEMALISQARLQAYLTAREIRGDFQGNYYNNQRQVSPVPQNPVARDEASYRKVPQQSQQTQNYTQYVDRYGA